MTTPPVETDLSRVTRNRFCAEDRTLPQSLGRNMLRALPCSDLDAQQTGNRAIRSQPAKAPAVL
jgi:hypothetical protein